MLELARIGKGYFLFEGLVVSVVRRVFCGDASLEGRSVWKTEMYVRSVGGPIDSHPQLKAAILFLGWNL